GVIAELSRTKALEAANHRLAEENEHRRQLESERTKLEAKIEQSKKLESLGLMAGGIAHDFNNILMAVLGHADLGLEHPDLPRPIEGRLRDIRSAAWQAAELCRQMLAYAGKRRLQHSEVDLSHLVAECLDTIRVTAPPALGFDIHLPAGLSAVHGDTTQLRQVISNLITNATEAFGESVTGPGSGADGGTVTVTTETRTLRREDFADMLLAEPLPAGTYLVLSVVDDGLGMDEATRRRIFDPFFTTKFTGRGLGLAATLGIVRAHQGTLKVDSEPGRGTRVEVFLPALDHVATAPTRNEPNADTAPPRGGTVLIVDDEAIVRDVASLMLGNAGFDVIEAESGEQAITLFEKQRRRIGAVLVDLTMPGLDGVETFEALRKIDPEVVAILSSGYSADDIAERYVEIGFASFLHKPYQARTLRRAVIEAIEPRRQPSVDDQEPGSSSGARVSSTGAKG
ncbi:MAG: response regulator, partial [Acidobacteriota bacterium]